MTQANYEEREIWTTGRRGCNTSVSATIYPRSIVATSDGAHITESMMEKALDREFPRHVFYFNLHGRDYIRCDADRFTEDGV